MVQETLMIITLVSIWLSLCMSIVTLSGATDFWLAHSTKRVTITPLSRYPMITIVVPAHNEEVVIAQTTRAILDMNYPADRVELLLFADNCADQTAAEMRRTLDDPRYRDRNVRIIERTGAGGKAGVLNDALKMAHGEYIGVYDADAMPETNALYFLVHKALADPERYVAVFGRNKTRNAQQNFLTRCINQEIVVTQRIQHCAIWHLFKIGRIPGTNFIIQRQFVQGIGGWRNGALTEDTDISFKIMQTGKLIALAYNSEAFQQEPERLRDYYFQRLRWAKGNYQVVIHNFRHLFDHSNWRVKLETFYYSCTFFWFNAAIVLSDIIFLANVGTLIARLFNPGHPLYLWRGQHLNHADSVVELAADDHPLRPPDLNRDGHPVRAGDDRSDLAGPGFLLHLFPALHRCLHPRRLFGLSRQPVGPQRQRLGEDQAVQ